MQKKILLVFFLVLFAGVVGILYSIFNYGDNETVETKKYLYPLKNTDKGDGLTHTWIDRLVKNQKSDFLYPVNELYMHINLKKYIPPKKTKSYKLVIQNISSYSLFCVMQTLHGFNLPFVLTKGKTDSAIYMDSSDKKKSWDNLTSSLDRRLQTCIKKLVY